MKISTIILFQKELEAIKQLGLSVPEYCAKYEISPSYYTNKIKRIVKEKDSNSRYQNIIDEVILLYWELNRKTTALYAEVAEAQKRIKKEETHLKESSLETIAENTPVDDFDGTTNVVYNRSSKDNKIVSYQIVVKVRDSINFSTLLSRSDAETIFGLYTYYGGNITARNVANEFPRYTLPEIKKIFRAFKLTKDSAWFPPHICEECTPEEMSQYRMNIKERAAFKYADATQERAFKSTINKMASEINKLSNFKDQLGEIIQEYANTNHVTPKYFPKVVAKNKTIMIFLSDMHIGAKVNSQAIFDNQYDMEVVLKRMDQIIQHFTKFKPCQKIVVVNLGDALDGMDNQTARRDHHIPQNMNNFEQINNYVKAINYLFTNLIENGNAAEYAYVSVPCGNHKK